MDQQVERRLRRYLEMQTTVSSRIDGKIRGINAQLANRAALEQPFGAVVGERRVRLTTISQRTGHPDLFMAYLKSKASALRLLRRDDFADAFLNALDQLLSSTKVRGQDAVQFSEGSIIGLIDKTLYAAHIEVFRAGFSSSGYRPDGMEDTDDTGSWGPAYRRSEG